jgi:single-stranded-DNA-specific exonuclease
MVGGSVYPPGVVGVVAGKLADEFYRPAIVLQLDGDNARGSARSIPEFDILAAMTECRDLLTRFGGHRQAAGFLMPRAKVDDLRRRITEVAGRDLAEVELRPTMVIDSEIPLSAVSGATFRMIGGLAPFGQGNRAPVFLSRNVKLLESRAVGANEDHLKLKLQDGRATWDAIAFNLSRQELSSHIDVVYNLDQDDWNGRQRLRLNIVDFLPSTLAAACTSPARAADAPRRERRGWRN